MSNKTNSKSSKTAPKKSMPKLPKEVKLDFEIQDIKEFLASGVQFGHQTKRWDPKMEKYIFAKRGDIHIIDLSQTIPLLESALKFLVRASSKGRVLMVATKRQAAEIVEAEAREVGAYFTSHRWPGGLLTNFNMVSKSFKRLMELENDFEKGVEGRTKYEISVMKKEWDRLSRLYQGVKTMDRKPQAIVIVDPNYERNAVREAQSMGIPIISIIDTNCDPDGIQYPIPANDDAVKSLKLLVGLLGKAIKQGNGGKGVTHSDKDYSKVDVKIVKPQVEEVQDEEVKITDVVEEDTSSESKSDEKDGLLGKARQKKTKTFKVKKKKESSSKKKDEKSNKEDKKTKEKKSNKKKKDKKDEKKELSSRIQTALEKEGVSMKDLESMKKKEIKDINGIGPKAVKEIEEYLD